MYAIERSDEADVVVFIFIILDCPRETTKASFRIAESLSRIRGECLMSRLTT